MENNFFILQTSLDHLDQIKKMQKLEEDFVVNVECIEKELLDSSFYYVSALKGKRVLGFSSMHILVDHSDIGSVYIDSTFRNQGIATNLIQHLIQKSKDLKLDKVFLEVSEDNKKAISIYTKLGFKQIDIRKKYYRNNKDAYIFMFEIK